MESNAVDTFLQNCVREVAGSVVTVNSLWYAYEDFCRKSGWEALPEKKAKRQLKAGISANFHKSLRNDCTTGAFRSVTRGYSGLKIMLPGY